MERQENIDSHNYGAYIFRTSDQRIRDYVYAITTFCPFVNTPIANYHGKTYNLPFNMNDFQMLWGVATQEKAKHKVTGQVTTECVGKGTDE